MKKLFFLTLLLTFKLSLKAQPLFNSFSNEISFFSEAPLDNISAINKDAKSLINPSNNEIAVILGIRNFKFEKAFMEEHFNENYLESHKYKTAVFKGKINEKIDFFKDGSYDVSATGKLNIHGVEQERTFNGTILIKGDTITLKTAFKIALKDHKIEIPKIVSSNIAEEVDVKAIINYEPKK